MPGELLARLRGVRQSGSGWVALCPAHDDRQPSLSVAQRDGRTLVKCHAGCRPEAIVQALGLELKDLFADRRRSGREEGGYRNPTESAATVQPRAGCTLAQYAGAKRLPVEFLRQLGLSDIHLGTPAIRIPYLDAHGSEVAVRFRLALDGDNRFRWRRGDKPCLYGLWRLDLARVAGYVVLVEGESDCHTLWLHEIPALGIPGAVSWRQAWAEFLAGIPVIYAVIEPDKGGEALLKGLTASSLWDRVSVVHLDEAKDPSDLYLADPEHFREQWKAAVERARPLAEHLGLEAASRTREAWEHCAPLAHDPRILDRFAEALAAQGVAGETRAGKLLYLVVTTRFLDRPVSAAVRGPSSAGKSYLVERVLQFLPPGAYYALSAMSEHALAYSREPLVHRFLVLYEAAGLQSPFAGYLMRSLLSEGRVRYETVEKTKDGLRPRMIEREGPTGLVLTTTGVKLPEDNETRLLSIPVTDTPEQTKAVLRRQAKEGGTPSVDLLQWRALQEWMEAAEHRVVIPYAETLAELIPPLAVRLRRDFPAVLALIKAHAILHQASRERDAEGRIIATLDDYAVVTELVADLIAEGLEASVPPSIRETVEAVLTLGDGDGADVTGAAVAKAVKLDKSAALRRARIAIERGYLKNLEDRRGRPAKLVVGDPLPQAVEVLPPAHALDGRPGCGVASEPEGRHLPPPPAFQEVVTAREPQSEGAGPPPCRACGGSRFWRSRFGGIVCATCHPPADPALVAGSLGMEPEER